MTTNSNDIAETDVSTGRRAFLTAAAAAGAGSLAGCGVLSGNGPGVQGPSITDFRGSGQIVEGRGAPGGTSITELPDLEGELTFYLSFGEGGLYLDLIDLFANFYPDFEYRHTQQSSSGLANRIIEEVEAGASEADLFIAVDAGSLASVAQAGATRTLPDSVLDTVPASLRTDQWVGIAGRARAIPYYTEAIDEADVPNSVQAFPDTPAFADAMGWAPTYSAFQSFITAMRLLRGRDETRAWLEDMVDHGITNYPNEFVVSNAVANGELRAGFANHYYALRVRNQRPDAPVSLAFTQNDAGALINVSGAEIIDGTDNAELAENFVRHLLSSEAQEFFATRTFAYPTVPEVDPVGNLPPVDELDPPEIDLQELADVNPTIELLRETDVL
ncbi:MAG: extracellular solute-binding protein [Salinirussus sp.]